MGLRASYVAKLVRKGMPTDSIASASRWRQENTGLRAPTDPKSVGRQIAGENDPSETNSVIPLSAARDLAFRGYDTILARVLLLPERTARHCNPADPHTAITLLNSECTAILVDAHPLYAAWWGKAIV